MAKLTYIKAIQAFEAVARHQSYIGAADELNVTPAAVGQQIRRDGGSRRLQLNSFAAEALAEFQRGFDHIELGIEKLKSRNTQNLITVTVSQVFMAKWLLPRLDDFTQKHPHIEVRLDITDAVVDIARKEADVAIRCGNTHAAGLDSSLIMKEELVVVGSESLLKKRKPLKKAEEILDFPLIHDTSPFSVTTFPSWHDWFAGQGITLSNQHKSLKINAPVSVVQAAINGQGIALARHVLVKDDIAAKRLVRVLPSVSHPLDWGYYLVCRKDCHKNANVLAFRNWVLANAKR
jgi:LysR family transcriptional regulator, glycine cleavage system transcriptional activator